MKTCLRYGRKARWPALGMTALIWACGGGGGGGSDPTPQPAPPTTPPPASPEPPPTDPLGAVQDEETEQFRLFAAMADDVFGPAYAGFDQAVRDLQTDIATFCSNLGSAQISEVQGGWREAMLAWQRAEVARAGPVEEQDRRLRIQFFPDHNDAVPTGVNRLLDGGLELTEERIANSSVGAQGLPAIEFLLFEPGGFDNTQAGMRRCDLLQAVGANLATMAFDLATAWSETGAYYADFVNASGSFDDRFDVLIAIIESAAVQTEYMGDRKLRDALAADYTSLESWRSEHSRENLLANLEAVEALLENGEDYGFADLLERVYDAGGLVTRIEEQMTIAANGLTNLGDSLEDVLQGATVADVDEIHLAIQRLADLYVESAAAAGVTLGFNNMDGD